MAAAIALPGHAAKAGRTEAARSGTVGANAALAAEADVADVVAKALAFKAMLTSTQQGILEQAYAPALARKWSNLPCGSSCRNGIQFSALTADQLAAALVVIAAAAGAEADQGYSEFIQINKADSVLGVVSNSSSYSKGIYFIAFLNPPTATGKWMLQFGGHHYAGNIAFNNGAVTGATPIFQGVEPASFADAGGTPMAPLNQERTAFVNLLASLSTQESAAAKLSGTFGDITLGPNQDGNFPVAKSGVKADSLTALQQSLVLAAMDPYLNDADAATAAALRAVYADELADTYIAYAGGAALNANRDYVRIDGPSVWIEFVCQSGVVYPNQIHYHSIWRDRVRDYGNDLANATLRTSAAPAKRKARFTVATNPSNDQVSLSLQNRMTDASIIVSDMAGKTLFVRLGVSGREATLDIGGLRKGIYSVRVEDQAIRLTSRFTKL
jgi:hypothetical protein